jgi:hypothetical protein
MHVPGMPRAAQSALSPNKPIEPRITGRPKPPLRPSQPMSPPEANPLSNEPIKPKRMISDDDVNVVDNDHMRNIEHSADHLGL